MDKDVQKAIIDGDWDFLADLDLVTYMQHYMQRAGYYIRPDGKIDKLVRRQDLDDPWIYINHPPDNTCGIYHRITHGIFGIVPKQCQESCVKVAIYPISLKELIEVFQVLIEKPYPAKCGIDEREYGQLFGGYIYTDTLSSAVLIEKELKFDLGGIRILVKRGCTEFGDPDKWKYNEKDARIEKLINQWVAVDNNVYHQPPYQIAHIVRRWREHAVKHNAKG